MGGGCARYQRFTCMVATSMVCCLVRWSIAPYTENISLYFVNLFAERLIYFHVTY